jgi:hypothetical protein
MKLTTIPLMSYNKLVVRLLISYGETTIRPQNLDSTEGATTRLHNIWNKMWPNGKNRKTKSRFTRRKSCQLRLRAWHETMICFGCHVVSNKDKHDMYFMFKVS